MLQRPEKYLSALQKKFSAADDVSDLTLNLIQGCDDNLHFTAPKRPYDFSGICTGLAAALTFKSAEQNVTPEIGQRFLHLKHRNSARTIRAMGAEFVLVDEKRSEYRTTNLDNYISLTDFEILRQSRWKQFIDRFEETYKATEPSHFHCHYKLLVLADFKIFQQIDGEVCPACFVSANDSGGITVQHNSPIFPKVVVLKSLQLLDAFLQKFPSHFTTCLAIGTTRVKHATNSIRKAYFGGRFTRLLLFTEHPIKDILGSNVAVKCWNWTMPEIAWLHKMPDASVSIQEVPNVGFDEAAETFYQAVKSIEASQNVLLHDAYRWVRRLCYEWSLCCDSNKHLLQNIEGEFEQWLLPWLHESLLPSNKHADCNALATTMLAHYKAMLRALNNGNKSEAFKAYGTPVSHLITPSGLAGRYNNELRRLRKPESEERGIKLNSLQALQQMGTIAIPKKAVKSEYLAITPGTTQCTALSRIENGGVYFVTTIYRHGGMEKLLSALTCSSSHFTLLLYGTERRAWEYHVARHNNALKQEWASADRYSISGIRYEGLPAPFSLMKDWVGEMEESAAKDDTEFVRIRFTDRTSVKLPVERGVLRIAGKTTSVIRAGELGEGDEVRIYFNKSPELLRKRIAELQPELAKLEMHFAALWKDCLLAYFRAQIISREALYRQLQANGFSVRFETMEKYLSGDVRFPRRHRDLLAIARTIADPLFSEDVLRTQMLPVISSYDGLAVSCGQQIADGINHFIITDEGPESLTGWLSVEEIKGIAAGIQKRKVTQIELLTTDEIADDE